MKDPAYLDFIRQCGCVVCCGGRVRYPITNPGGWPATNVEAAHVGERGLGQKCSDRETIPLCARHHRTGPQAHHVMGKRFFEHHGLDREKLLAELNSLYEREYGKTETND